MSLSSSRFLFRISAPGNVFSSTLTACNLPAIVLVAGFLLVVGSSGRGTFWVKIAALPPTPTRAATAVYP